MLRDYEYFQRDIIMSSTRKILIVDDDDDLRESLVDQDCDQHAQNDREENDRTDNENAVLDCEQEVVVI